MYWGIVEVQLDKMVSSLTTDIVNVWRLICIDHIKTDASIVRK